MNIRIRSEGALEHVEDAIRRYEKIEELLELPVERMQHALPSAEVETDAIARLEKLDAEPIERLAAIRNRVAEATRKQLRERDIEPTATRPEDLLAQLIARANVPRAPPAPEWLTPRALWVAFFCIAGFVLVVTFWLYRT